jgi:hypothetical protein
MTLHFLPVPGPTPIDPWDTIRLIAETPKQGEPCPDDPRYSQAWDDDGIQRPLDALHGLIDIARAALRKATT